MGFSLISACKSVAFLLLIIRLASSLARCAGVEVPAAAFLCRLRLSAKPQAAEEGLFELSLFGPLLNVFKK
jgi:hypothetical protein